MSETIPAEAMAPPELESSPPLKQFTPEVGPARVMLGEYGGANSPAKAPGGITYLLVTLYARETWTSRPPARQSVAFVAFAQGNLELAENVGAGELAAFAPGEVPIVPSERFVWRGVRTWLGSTAPARTRHGRLFHSYLDSRTQSRRSPH